MRPGLLSGDEYCLATGQNEDYVRNFFNCSDIRDIQLLTEHWLRGLLDKVLKREVTEPYRRRLIDLIEPQIKLWTEAWDEVFPVKSFTISILNGYWVTWPGLNGFVNWESGELIDALEANLLHSSVIYFGHVVEDFCKSLDERRENEQKLLDAKSDYPAVAR